MSFAFALLLAAAAAPKPQLCIDGQCTRVESALPLRVTESDHVRRFTWISADGKRWIVGTIEAGGTEAKNDSAAKTHRLVVRPSDGAALPALKFELVDGSATWSWNLDRPSSDAIDLFHPGAGGTLKITAAGYARVERQLTKTPDTIYLHKLPSLRGRTVDAKTLLPLAGVDVVALPAGTTIATTDRNGRFSAVVDGAWPKFLRVGRADHASRILDVPRTVADTELNDIALSSGGTLSVTIAPPFGGREELSWTLRKVTTSQRDEQLAREGALPTGQSEATIDRLDAGTYRLTVSGSEPLQKYAMLVKVDDATASRSTVRIRPAVLDLTVKFDGAPLANAVVEINEQPSQWHAVLHCDDAGHALQEVWQQGDYHLAVARKPDVTGWMHVEHIEGDGRIPLELNIPNHRVRGRVLDARTDAPLGNARVSLGSRTADGNALYNISETTADGQFQFSGVTAGQQVLQVMAPGYIRDTKWQFTMADDDVLHEEDLRVDPIEGHSVTVVDARGVPIPSAVIIAAKRNGTYNVGLTDGDGKIVVPIAGDEPGLIYAIPKSGSFGFVRLPLKEASEDPVVLRVSDGSASLTLRAENESGEPIGRIHFAFRVDGEMIVPDVNSVLTNYQGAPLLTDANGEMLLPHLPPGHYDIWTITNRDDFRAVFASPVRPLPTTSVTLTPGDQALIVKLKPKNP